MGDNLAELLYVVWRSSQADPSTQDVWGNLDSESRRGWEAVAAKARNEMANRFFGELRSARDELADGAVDYMLERWGR